MPNLQNFTIQVQTDASLNVSRFLVGCQVTDNAGVVLNDFTGANAIQFGFRVLGLTAQQHRDIVERIINDVIRIKAGLAS